MRAYDAEAVVKSIGRRVAELRRERGLTQEQLAVLLGASFKWVSLVERGQNLTVHTLVKLANNLKVSLASLLKAPKPSSRAVKPGRPKKTKTTR